MDNSANECAPDRGAFNHLTFTKCARGFILYAPSDYDKRTPTATFAFDKIEDLAAWLVEQYGPPKQPTGKPTATKRRATGTRRRR